MKETCFPFRRFALTRYFVAGTVLMCSCIVGCSPSPPPPTDQELLQRFEQERSAFERLFEISQSQIVDGRIRMKDPEGLRLMERLGVHDVGGGEGEAFFECTDWSNDFRKGYYYAYPDDGVASIRPKEMSGSLDGIEIEPYEWRFREIGHGWYLFIYRWHD